jgi:hypothetical protein
MGKSHFAKHLFPGWVHFRLVLTAAVVLFIMMTMAPPASAIPFCSNTSNDAKLACFHEAKDDFWIARGKCNNLSSGRGACRAAATLVRQEDFQSCREQFRARQDVCALLGQAPYDPVINPANFVDPAQIGVTVTPNQFFPLVAGTVRTYSGAGETITVTVTALTKVIQGVTCRVVTDVVQVGGQTIEDTEDWFAQDVDGNVWYFGEIAQDFVDGELVSIDGSWKAGVNGDKAGIVMKAAPVVGETYRQEFSLGNAEDLATVLSITASETSPFASCAGTCVQTKDFSPLDPEAIENKYYAPGVGLILEVAVDENGIPIPGTRVELISVTP